MLQQILKDMWVDPALLAELDDDQKQTLFCRMREEQVRRWRIWDQQDIQSPQAPPAVTNKSSKRRVQFLNGEDGEPWVWVMGEHPDDLSIEEILEKEARGKARKQAEQEAQQLRRSVEVELSELLDLNQKQIQEMEAVVGQGSAGEGEDDPPSKPSPPDDKPEMIYCSVDELKIWNLKCDDSKENLSTNNTSYNGSKGIPSPRKGANVRALNARNAPVHVPDDKSRLAPRVAQRVAQWERRELETRTEQILTSLKRRQMEAAREAEEMAPIQERLWQEQERRAKEAEQQIREIARRAREEHRRTSVLEDSPTTASPNSQTASPPTSVSESLRAPSPPLNRDAVIRWYRETEIGRRAGLDSRGYPEPWFHGLISRQEAECRLSGMDAGAFLVRLSERLWGYAISYRDSDRCKHYLVDTAGGSYQFLGANQICHASLGDLVSYHRNQPITLLGGERLLQPCGHPHTPISSAATTTAVPLVSLLPLPPCRTV